MTPDGRHLYAADFVSGPNTISAFAVGSSGGLSAVSGSPFIGGNSPLYLAVSPDQGPIASFADSIAPAGSASSFDGSASSDPDGTVARYDWDFGDGTGAQNGGPNPTHTYTTPGSYTVTLTVTDDAGCSTMIVFTGQTAYCNGTAAARTTRMITVFPTALGSVPPVAVSALRVSPKKLSIAGRKVNTKCVGPTKKNHAKPRCLRTIKLKISYTLSRADTVTFTLERKAPGRKVNGKCVKPTHKNRHKAKCTRLIGVRGKLVKTGKAGANSFRFNGKIGGHKLAPGIYQLTAKPTGGNSQTVTFTIVG
jgi:hypothetical protein